MGYLRCTHSVLMVYLGWYHHTCHLYLHVVLWHLFRWVMYGSPGGHVSWRFSASHLRSCHSYISQEEVTAPPSPMAVCVLVRHRYLRRLWSTVTGSVSRDTLEGQGGQCCQQKRHRWRTFCVNTVLPVRLPCLLSDETVGHTSAER